MLRNRSWRT